MGGTNVAVNQLLKHLEQCEWDPIHCFVWMAEFCRNLHLSTNDRCSVAHTDSTIVEQDDILSDPHLPICVESVLLAASD